VDFWFGVATHAIFGDIAKQIPGQIITDLIGAQTPGNPMTIGASEIGMSSIQGEIRALVIEARHTVLSVVAGQAVLAKILDMLEHKGRIFPAMAGDTPIQLHCKTPCVHGVASNAFHRGRVVIHLMPYQGKRRARMIEQGKSALSGIEIFSAMVRMASGTAVYIFNESVGASATIYLESHLAMTGQAEDILGSLQGLMATATFRLKLSMGNKSFQADAWQALSAQFARTKHLASA
jgi:hypothetical protein